MRLHHNFAKVEQCKYVAEWDRCQCSLQELNQHKQAVQFCFEHALFNSLKDG